MMKYAAWVAICATLLKLSYDSVYLITGDCDLVLAKSTDKKEFYRNKVVWITGGSSGIGAAFAEFLLKKNVGVRVILSSRDETKLQQKKQELLQSTTNDADKIQIIALDLSNLEELDEKANQAIALFGKIDILVNNGGISQRSFGAETSFDVDQKIMTVDFLSYVKLTKAVLPSMIKARSGLIVNVSSLAGKMGTPLRTAYSAAKFAVLGFFNGLRIEQIENNIHILNVCPGSVLTDISLNAVNSQGNKHGLMDDAIANGMKVERCAELIATACSNHLDEVWLFGSTLEKFATYLFQYAPYYAFNLQKSVAESTMQKSRDMIHKDKNN